MDVAKKVAILLEIVANMVDKPFIKSPVAVLDFFLMTLFLQNFSLWLLGWGKTLVDNSF